MMQHRNMPIYAGLAGAVALVLVGAAVLSWPVRHGADDDARTARTILIPVPPSDTGQSLPGRDMPANPPLPVDGGAPVTPVGRRILASSGDQHARVRYLKAADGGGAIYCGEISTRDHPNYRPFLWMDAVSMLAMDDGSPDFTDIAKACNGRGKTS